MSPDRDLHSDHKTVNSAEQSYASIEEKILHYDATPEEIVKWYESQDPLQETHLMLDSRYRNDRDIKIASQNASSESRKIFAFERAASIILAEVALPELFKQGPRQTYEIASEMYEEEVRSGNLQRASILPVAILSINRGDKISPYTFNYYILSKLLRSGQNFDHEQLKKLSLGTELIYRTSLNDDQFISPDGTFTRKPQGANRELTKAYLSFIAQECLKSENIETRLLGLDAKLTDTSIGLADIKVLRRIPEARPMLVDFDKMLLNFLANYIKEVFQDDKNIDLKSALVRGKLHEAIWFMDFNLLSLKNNNDKLLLFPSLSYQDRPIIGKPTSNRAFDFFIKNIENHSERLIQLKSKPERYKKIYHPGIKTYVEKNFQEVNPRILFNTLKRYEIFLDENSEESWIELSKRILPTAREVYDECVEVKGSLLADQLIESYIKRQIVPRNKNARRRLRKELIKRGITPKF